MSRDRNADRRPMLVRDDRQWPLHDGEHIIGRGEAVAVRIDAAGVSRHHARVVVKAGLSTIEDLGSKNGTFAGQERIPATPRPLRDGDVIHLGRRVRLLFRHGGDDETVSEASSVRGLAGALFRREGALWTMMFEGQIVRLPDAKGFQDLARLLARPRVEVHCLDLADRPAEAAGALPDTGGGTGGLRSARSAGSAGREDRVLDDRAQREIRARARELRQEIDEADAANDLGRAERAREELERILELLSGALGLGGRARALGSPAERARSSVTWRIRSAIKRIEAVHPRLARHLGNAVRTGTFCVYEPESPIDWTV